MERLFDLDWQLIADSMLTIIAVGILFFFMSYFLFNPVRKLLADRQSKIKTQLDDARSNMEQAAKVREEYEEKLKNVEKEAEEILNLAEALADSEKDFEAMDAGRWNLSVRNETDMEKTKSGSFLFGQEESIRTLCAAIRAAVGKEDLFLLDGGE